MSKPTPGPYEIESVKFNDGHSFVVNDARPIATFWGPIFPNNADEDEARANAEAWMAGVAALEKLDRIREAMSSGRSSESVLNSINHILDEAKP